MGEDRSFSDYSWGVDRNHMYSMIGVRQFFKEWHAFKVIEEHVTTSATRILDIGCGVGEIGMMVNDNYAELNRPVFHSVDVTNKPLHITQPPGSKHFVRDLTAELPSSLGNSYDIVFMYDFIQSINHESAERIIADLPHIQVLGGKLCIHTRNMLMEAETDREHHLWRPDVTWLIASLHSAGYSVDNIFGINYGQSEDDLPPEQSLWDRFMPKRVRRITHSLGDWHECKWVLVDATRIR